MQSELLDITIIGCLVLLFASTYRKRTTPMMQSWTLGWLLILVHFVALLFHPQGSVQELALSIISLGSLVTCGIVFLLAAGNTHRTRNAQLAFPLLAGLASISFIVLQNTGVTTSLPYFLAATAITGLWIACSVCLQPLSLQVRGYLILSTFASGGWLLWTIVHRQEDVGISALLAQLYLFVGITYMGTFRRVSAATLTMVFGLVAWAAVFPAGEFCNHLGILDRISPEFWNVPKYFVAFGMLLMLLEEEIIAANKASKHYQLLFDANPHPMWIYDPETLAFQGVNDAAIAQYGFSREQFLQMTLDNIRAPQERTAASVVNAGVNRREPEQHRKCDGSLCYTDVATHLLQSSGRDLAFSLVQDVTEREELHQRLFHQANHDLLTGLPNRACLEGGLRKTTEAAATRDQQSALLCLDVDRFKQINDTYGHGVGDLCLQEVARRLAHCVRDTGIAARIGGEEFALLLPSIADIGHAKTLANNVLDALQAPIQAGIYTIELTASIGISVYPADGQDGATLWRNADCAMYRAKRAGGNQYLCMSALIGAVITEENEMEIRLRRALREGSLEIHYQPLYKITGELYGLEALVRLPDPELGLISPNRFIPLAEERGLIVPLGDWVLNDVCTRSALWQREGLPPVRVALNISPLQISRPDFAARVAEALILHGVDPHLLGIEITETAMMRNIGEASRQLTLLSALGVSVSVDDFGTGYSSLGQIDKLPVQCLKIDCTFTDRILLSGGTYSIVDAIISMAHSLGLQVVAEGVESLAQWECLRTLNCDIIQGYLFSQPLTADETIELLRSENTALSPLLLPERGPHLAARNGTVLTRHG